MRTGPQPSVRTSTPYVIKPLHFAAFNLAAGAATLSSSWELVCSLEAVHIYVVDVSEVQPKQRLERE